MNSFLIFTDTFFDISDNNSIVIEMSGSVLDKNSLFQDFSSKLHFPDYFGYNWDAFNDCLYSLDWLLKKNLVLLYRQLPNICKKDLQTFLSILYDYLCKQKENNDYHIYIVFPTNVQHIVETIIKTGDI